MRRSSTRHARNRRHSFEDGIDSAAQNFQFATLGTFSARYRVQGVKSAECDRTKGATDTVAAVTTQAVGLLGNHIVFRGGTTSTTLTGAGKMSGRVLWDPAGSVPEGGSGSRLLKNAAWVSSR